MTSIPMTSPTHVRMSARQRWLAATALTLMWAIAPDAAFGQAQRAAPPAAQADPMAQIQQMQRQMEQLQRQIQTMQAQQQGGRAPAAAPAPMAQPNTVSAPVATMQPRMAPQTNQMRTAAPAKAPAKAAKKKTKAVTKVTPKKLKNTQARTTVAAAKKAPNTIAVKSVGNAAKADIFIRGTGNAEPIGTMDSAVGMYIDDVYVARPTFTNFELFDLDGIDIARGSQGTAVSRNSIGGAMHVMFQKPQPNLMGNFEVGYGKHGDKSVRGAINAPLSDALYTQLGVYFNDDSGYGRNTTNTIDKLNDKRNYGVRIATQANIMDGLTWNLAVNHTYSDELNTLNFRCRMGSTLFASPGAPTPATACSGRFARTSLAEKTIPSLSNLTVVTPSGAVPTTLANVKQERKVGAPTRNSLVSSNFAYEFSPAMTLNFITGYTDLSHAYTYDLQDGRAGRNLTTPTPSPAVAAAAPNGYNTLTGKTGGQTWSQEARLSGDVLNGAIEYVGGVVFAQDRSRFDMADVVLSSVTADRLVKLKTTTYAVFSEFDFHLTQNFTTTAGIRYTNDNRSIFMRDLRNSAALPVVGGVPRPDLRIDTINLASSALPEKVKTKIFSPRVAFSYDVNPSTTGYISATRGFRAGGWNIRGTDSSTFTRFDPEKAWTYELGVKAALPDDTFSADIAVFNTDVTDKQVTNADVGAGLIANYVTTTPANFRSRGIETEFNLVPWEGMNLYTTAAYQTASYKSIPTAINTQAAACRALVTANQPRLGVCGTGIVDALGAIAKPVYTPKLSGATGLAFDMPTGLGFVFTPTMNVSYTGRYETDVANVSYFASADPNTNPAAVTNRPNVTTGTGTASSGGSGFISGSRSGKTFMFNAGMSVGAIDERWSAAIECTNCLGKTYPTASVAGYSLLSEPMRWNLRLRTAF
jgi:iron complex outermembrane recepter protein